MHPIRWFRSLAKPVKIGCLVLLIPSVLFFCSAAAVGIWHGSPNTPAAQSTATPTAAIVQSGPTDAPTPQPTVAVTTTHAVTPTVTPSPTATPKPTVQVTHQPTPKPTQPPTPTHPSCQGVNGNPWCYDFNSPGNLIYYPPSGFCNYFNCIASFYGSDDPGDGYIIQCQDGTFSQSGGERGACSSHGGESRPLYSH